MTKLRLTTADHATLHSHLFQADQDEHGAIVLAGIRQHVGETVLLGRELHLLTDEEFPPGSYGYRQLAAQTLARLGNRAAAQRLALVSCHSHPSSTAQTRLSRDDLAGHARVFPHLLDIVDGAPVAGVAFGSASAAGEVWSPNAQPVPMDCVELVGHQLQRLTPTPGVNQQAPDERFDRQARMFGADGQQILRNMTVSVIGAGGGGSMIIEQLAHLGVGRILAVDFDTVQRHNLSRIVGATDKDAAKRRKKVHVARRLVAKIDPTITFDAIDGNIADADTARRLLPSDFMFLATDTITSRLVANAIVQTHFIPMIQVGAKIDLRADAEIESIYIAVRPVFPGHGCLHCAGLISPIALQQENATAEERTAQNYVGLPEVTDPSVITLNGIAASTATNIMMMTAVGLAHEDLLAHRLLDAQSGRWLELRDQRNPDCLWCGPSTRSRYGRGDATDLPVRRGSAHTQPARHGRLHRWGTRLRHPRAAL